MAWRTNLFGALAFLVVGGAALVLPAVFAVFGALVWFGLGVMRRHARRKARREDRRD